MNVSGDLLLIMNDPALIKHENSNACKK